MNHRPTIIDLLNSSVEKYANNPFLWEKTTSQFEPTTYAETKSIAHKVAAGLLALGTKYGDKISLLSEGRNAWIYGELGILLAGAVNVPLSIKLEESNDLLFRLIHSESKYLIVSASQLKKIRPIASSLTDLKQIIIIDAIESYREKEISLSEVIRNGETLLVQNANVVEERAQMVQPDDVATISYTSGTTADPKGVMLTHRNYTANVEQALTLMTIPTHFRTLIILPLDHCFAHVAGFYSFMASGASVATVQNGKTGLETLKNIPTNIKEIKPNLLLSVPALAKNFKKNIETNIKSQGKLVMWLFNTALKMSYSYNKEGYNKGQGLQALKKPFLALFDKILFAKIRDGFGGNLEFFIGGGALLDIDLQRFYYAIGIPMCQGYGLSEATPIISSNSVNKQKLGSSGYLVTPLELRIVDADGKELPTGDKGEIVIKGENVMSGYYKNAKSTSETLKDGWLYTGDMGYIDSDNFLYVLGRFKSLLIASDGEKYSPEGIEESLVENSKFIDQVLLYNNQHPFTSAIIVPKYDVLRKYIQQKHPHISWDSREAKELALVKLQKEIDEYRKGGKFEGTFPERWLPASLIVAKEPFTEQNGLVNSTMKIIRGKVEKLYSERIEYLYTSKNKDIITDDNIASLH